MNKTESNQKFHSYCATRFLYWLWQHTPRECFDLVENTGESYRNRINTFEHDFRYQDENYMCYYFFKPNNDTLHYFAIDIENDIDPDDPNIKALEKVIESTGESVVLDLVAEHIEDFSAVWCLNWWNMYKAAKKEKKDKDFKRMWDYDKLQTFEFWTERYDCSKQGYNIIIRRRPNSLFDPPKGWPWLHIKQLSLKIRKNDKAEIRATHLDGEERVILFGNESITRAIYTYHNCDCITWKD